MVPYIRHAILAAYCCAAPLTATTINPVSNEELVKRSDLIFQGVVTRIDHRMSGFRTTADARIPHTFVTFQVEKILKGKHTGQSNLFTLRLMGGADPSAGRFLTVGGCPDFDIGERVILFVRRNERSICPIAGWPQGRFRIVNGGLFSDSGHEIWRTPQNKLAVGPGHNLPEARTHHRGGKVFAHLVSSPPGSEAPVLPETIAGTRLSVNGFLSFIGGLVSTLHTPLQLLQLAPVKTAAVDQPFYVTQPGAVGASAPQQ